MNLYPRMTNTPPQRRTLTRQTIRRLVYLGAALSGSVYCMALKAKAAVQPGVSKGTACRLESPCQRCGASYVDEAISSPKTSPALPANVFQGKGGGVCSLALGPDSAATSLQFQDASLTMPLPRPQNSGDVGNQESEQPGVSSKGTQKNNQSKPALQGSPRHIFLIVPAFHVSYLQTFKPLTPHEKFQEWLSATYDPRGIALFAAEATTLEHSSTDGFCGYGKGGGAYGKCFASMEADSDISSFLGDFLFPVMMHQDPRYFRMGEGSFGSRLWYAVSRVAVTHSDSGRWVFYSSALSGSALAAGISNLYYPPQDRGLGPSLTRVGIDLGNTALFNVSAEFWPDIKHKIIRVF